MNKLLKHAIDLIRTGEVIAAPTDTVYGLLGDATNDIAVKKIYMLKNRPLNKQLIVLVSGLDMAQEIADFSPEARDIANFFWINQQKPLTLVLHLKQSNNLSKLITAGYQTIALRRPSNSIALALIKELNLPLVAPSANISSHISATSANMVREEFGQSIKLVLDSPICKYGIESTILDMTKTPYTIVRTGSVTNDEIFDFLKKHLDNSMTNSILTSNSVLLTSKQFIKTYRLKLPLRINAMHPSKGEAFIAFGKTNIKHDINISPTGNLKEAARNLFKAINMLDNPNKYSGIAIMPIQNQGLGISINNILSHCLHSNNWCASTY